MLTALVLIGIISLLVLVHEFGHFYAARKAGVRVEEFGLGIPPRIFGKKIGETIYSLNWLPFGGFVKLTGEDFSDEADPDEKNFKSKSPLRRISILGAGVFMNATLAVVLYYMLFSITGFKTMTLPRFFDYDFAFGAQEKVSTVVVGFSEDSAGKDAGIEAGEAVIEVSGQPVYSAGDLRRILASLGAENAVSVLLMDVRGLERDFRTIQLTPRSNEKGEVLLGVLLSDAVRLDYSGQKHFAGLQHAYNMSAYSLSTLGNFFSMAFSQKDPSIVSDNISGPVGISQAVSAVLSYEGKEALVGLIDLTALLSISLAILNLMPFPALDGGRLIFVVFELFTGKKISERIEGKIHHVGMLLLLSLLVLVTIKDVKNLF